MIQESNTASYDVLSETYDSNIYLRSDEENLIKKYFTDTAAPLLVVGCGAGRIPWHLHQMGYTDITAVDISEGMIEKAKAKLKNMRGVRVLQADVVHLSFDDDSFQYVFFPFHGIDYVPERKRALIEMRRVLKPEGILAFTSHNLLSPKGIAKCMQGKRGRYLHLYENGNVLLTYHTTMAEVFSLQKLFRRAHVYSRTTLQQTVGPGVKGRIIRLLPFLDKSLYFVVQK